jgi:hypothetical protein
MSNESLKAEMRGSVRLEGMNQAGSDHLVGLARARARELEEQGPLNVAGDAGETGSFVIGFDGAIPCALRVLESRTPDGERFFPERASSSLVVRATPVSQTNVIAITDHLMGASENHPEDDAPLEFRTEYDEAGRELTVSLSGSVFATNYLMLLVWLHLTQSRH